MIFLIGLLLPFSFLSQVFVWVYFPAIILLLLVCKILFDRFYQELEYYRPSAFFFVFLMFLVLRNLIYVYYDSGVLVILTEFYFSILTILLVIVFYFSSEKIRNFKCFISGFFVSSIALLILTYLHFYIKVTEFGYLQKIPVESIPSVIWKCGEFYTPVGWVGEVYRYLEYIQFRMLEYSANAGLIDVCSSARVNGSRSGGYVSSIAEMSFLGFFCFVYLAVKKRFLSAALLGFVVSSIGYATGFISLVLVSLMMLSIEYIRKIKSHHDINYFFLIMTLFFILIVSYFSIVFSESLKLRVKLVFDNIDYYLVLYLEKFSDYFLWVSDHPFLALFGSGFSSLGYYSYPQGGDFGIVELLASLGLVFILMLFYILVKSYFLLLRGFSKGDFFLISFFGLVGLILFSVHYGVLLNKSIYPLFIVLLLVLFKRDRLEL